MTKRAILVGLAVAMGVTSFSLAVDKLSLRRKQIDQQRARAMAQKLVSTAVDLQLNQLEDNGLTDLPIYKEISAITELSVTNVGYLIHTAVKKLRQELRQEWA